MSMEKFGVEPGIQHTELRDEEASLMQKVGSMMGDPQAADEVRKLEQRLHAIRSKLTDLDGAVSAVPETVAGSEESLP